MTEDNSRERFRDLSERAEKMRMSVSVMVLPADLAERGRLVVALQHSGDGELGDLESSLDDVERFLDSPECALMASVAADRAKADEAVASLEAIVREKKAERDVLTVALGVVSDGDSEKFYGHIKTARDAVFPEYGKTEVES